MKQYLKCLLLVLLSASVFTLQGRVHQAPTSSEAVALADTVEAKEQTQQTEATELTEVPVEVPKPKPEPELVCGPHSPEKVLNLILEQGVPKTAAIQLLGSWKTESGGGFDQCQKHGDGGQAWGLNSWHYGRRRDMPMELGAQVKWAIHTELKRDCENCYRTLMDPASSVWQVRSAIQQSTRWGVLGGRWLYADQFASMF